MSVRGRLYDSVAGIMGWPSSADIAAARQSQGDGEIQKNLQEYASMAVPPVHGAKQEPASWIVDRNEYVKHYRNTVYAAVGAIARKVAMQRVQVCTREINEQGESLTPVPLTHPLQELFTEVNPRDTQWDLWFYTAAWRLMVGDTYWWKARNGFGVPTELWHFPPQWVHAIPSDTEYVGGYQVHGVFGKKPQFVPAADVVHMREPTMDWSGNGRYYGLPALAATAVPVDLEDSMYKRLFHLFKNYAPPSQIFSTDQELDRDQVRDIVMQIGGQHRLAEHTGRPMVTHSGMKPHGSSSPKEMDYARSLEATMDKILMVFGVPKSILGLTSSFNRANMEASMLSFCEMTINPMLDHIAQHLTQGLAREFEPNLVVKFPKCTVEDVGALQRAMQIAASSNAVTPDEVREGLLDLGPLKRGGAWVTNKAGEQLDIGNPTDEEIAELEAEQQAMVDAAEATAQAAESVAEMANESPTDDEFEKMVLSFDDEIRKALTDLPEKKKKQSANGHASGNSRPTGSNGTYSHS